MSAHRYTDTHIYPKLNKVCAHEHTDLLYAYMREIKFIWRDIVTETLLCNGIMCSKSLQSKNQQLLLKCELKYRKLVLRKFCLFSFEDSLVSVRSFNICSVREVFACCRFVTNLFAIAHIYTNYAASSCRLHCKKT